MGNLPAPIRSKEFNRYGNEHYQACVCSMQGHRANMEDSNLVHLSFKSHPLYSLFAIFDGHNGGKAAEYLSKHLVSKLDALSTLTDNKQIQQVILSMDEEFCKSQHGQSGSTIVFAIVKPIDSISIIDGTLTSNNNNNNILNKQNSNDNNIEDDQEYEIRIFWAGDSRAILIYNDCDLTFRELTCDHRPNNPSEKIRIETANGLIINNRIDSKLAVSRAFGDCSLKNNKLLSWEKQRVTSLTEYCTIYAKKNDKLFLFCDGLVEYLENNQLIKLLFKHLNKYEDPVYGLGYLFDEILEGGSRDNMTAIIIKFNQAIQYGNNGKHKTFLPGPLYMTRNDKKYVDAYLRNAKDFGHNDTPKLRRAAYREDLKFLRKYGMRGVMQQQLQYGKTAKSIISEIEQVIKEIDVKASEEASNSICEMKQETNGSTEIIGSTEVFGDDDSDTANNNNINNNNNKTATTPPLSDDESDIKDQDDDLTLTFSVFNNSVNKEKIAMEKSLTHLETPLKRNNSVVVTPSVSPKDDNSNSNSNSKKRTFKDMNNVNDMNEMDININSASKRRKENNGNAVKIHMDGNDNKNKDKDKENTPTDLVMENKKI